MVSLVVKGIAFSLFFYPYKSQMSYSNCMTRISTKPIPLAIPEKCFLALQPCFNMYVQLHFGTFLSKAK